MDYFFRMTPDTGFTFNMALVRLGLILFLFVIYHFRYKIWVLRSLLVLSVILQGILYWWYTHDSELFLMEGLPLYHCRIAGICLPLAFFFKKKKAMTYFSDLALVGTVIAFAVPDPSDFAWPHVTNLTYILNHYVLIACGLLVCENYHESLSLREIVVFSGFINSVIFIVDLFLGANYGYLTSVPIEFFKNVPVPLVFALMTGLMVGVLYLVEIIKKKQFVLDKKEKGT